MHNLGLYAAPAIRLPTFSLAAPDNLEAPIQHFLDPGTSESATWVVSPLQMALATATLSNGGIRPAPRLLTAVSTSSGEWAPVPPLGQATPVFSSQAAAAAAGRLLSEVGPYWEALAVAGPAQAPATWFITGTLPDWPGAPIVLVVVLEGNDPLAAAEIGRVVMLQAMLGP